MISSGAPKSYHPSGRSLIHLHPQDRTQSQNRQSKLFFTAAETEISRDIFKALSNFTLDDDRKEVWKLRSSSPEPGEEEIYFSDSTLIWSKTDGENLTKLNKSFSMPNKIIDATWCSFIDDDGPSDASSDKSDLALCILNGNVVDIIHADGRRYPTPLPFIVPNLNATKYGLLLERKADNNSPPLPLLFSLTNPLKEVSPVIIKFNQGRTSKVTFLTPDTKLSLVGVSEEYSFVLCYHKGEASHTLFLLRRATPEDIVPVCSFARRSVDLSSHGDSPIFTSHLGGNASHPSGFTTSSPFHSSTSFSFKHGYSSSPSAQISSLGFSKSSSFAGSPAFSPLVYSRLASGSPASTFSSPSNFGASSPQRHSRKRFKDGDVYHSPSSRATMTPTLSQSLYEEDELGPIVPELSMEQIWTESQGGSLAGGRAVKFFVTTDLVNQTYIAFLVNQNLRLVRFELANDGRKHVFGSVKPLQARDAEPIGDLKMMMVLELNYTLSLYSGPFKVCRIHLPSAAVAISPVSFPNLHLTPSYTTFESPLNRRSLLASSRPSSATPQSSFFSSSTTPGGLFSPVPINESTIQSVGSANDESILSPDYSFRNFTHVSSIRDAVKNRVTFQNEDLSYYRIELPPIATSTIVKRCLDILKTVLPRDVCFKFFTKWYSSRNAPGTEELSAENELKLFKTSLLSCMGFAVENSNASFSSTASPEIIKKMKLEEKADDDDWYFLLNHKEGPDPLAATFSFSKSLLFPYSCGILFGFHLLYEDFKLKPITWSSAEKVVDLLFLLSSQLNFVAYQDHYWRDFPKMCTYSVTNDLSSEDKRSLVVPPYFTENPPSVYSTLAAYLKNENPGPYPFVENVTRVSQNVVLIFASAVNILRNDVLKAIGSKNSEPDVNEVSMSHADVNERLVMLADELGMDTNELNSLAPGVSALIWNAIFGCRKDPPATWSKGCYSLIARPDLCGYRKKPEKRSSTAVDDDGVTCLDYQVLRLLFPDDQRILDVGHMLQSSCPVRVCIEQKPGISERDFFEEQEKHLLQICTRTTALPIGRGMLTLRTYKPAISETFPIPKLCLTGKAPPRNQNIDLTHIDVPANITTWPLFHNGVAAGLRISPTAGRMVDSSWILYNKPRNPSSNGDNLNEHAGFLYALGLNGHLTKLNTMGIHEYLSKGNELTRVGVLLGYAAARRGTLDTAATKILSIHVEALLPPTSAELDVPPVVQVAAVLGVGLVYQGSGHHHVSEVLLNEIGRPPGPEMEHYIDRESYALAAGLAYGMVNLCRGETLARTVAPNNQLSVADQLRYYMTGGYRHESRWTQLEKNRAPSYQIREGDHINSHVTSPGATLALGLVFHKTNNDAVAKWLLAPDTQYLLESIRPDFLLLRTLSHGLIMWNSITNTREWVESYLPSIIIENAFQTRTAPRDNVDYETMSQCYANIVAGACMALSFKYAGTADETAFETVHYYTRKMIQIMSKPLLVDLAGKYTVESCVCTLLLSLATIMTGTGDVRILRICRYLRSRIAQSHVTYGSYMAIHMALGLLFLGGCRYTLSTTPESIAALVTAFFPKYPTFSNDNRYHLQALRHLYVLAAEPRLLIPRHVDTDKICKVRLRLKYNGVNSTYRTGMRHVWSPCLLPELKFLEEVVIDDERFWKIRFARDQNWDKLEQLLQDTGTVLVQQKVGYLTHDEDPKGFKSFHAQNLMRSAVKGLLFQPQEISSFTSHSIASNFSKLILSASRQDWENQFYQMIYGALLDVTRNETLELLPSLMQLFIYSSLNHSSGPAIWQTILAQLLRPKCASLESRFVESLQIMVEKRLSQDSRLIEEIGKYLERKALLSCIDTRVAMFATINGLPIYGSLPEGSIQEKHFVDLCSKLKGISMSTIMMIHSLVNRRSTM